MVSALLPLRDYQRKAIDAVNERFQDEALRRLAIVLPTGAGKTVVIAHKIKEYLPEHPDMRVLVLVHTDELVRQAKKKITDVAPHLSVGIVKARENETRADVIVASVQTLRSPTRMAQIRDVGLVIVDECHHAVARTYMTILDYYGCFTPMDNGRRHARAIGFTATLVRGDDKSLGLVWQDVAFSRDIPWMVRKQFLIPPRGLAVEVPDLDLTNVKSTRRDYREGELGEALTDSLAPELVAKAYAEHAGDRRGILFAPTVMSAEIFAEAFEEIGIRAEVIHGGLKQDERNAIIGRHLSGITQVVCNCAVLTEGYDDPKISCVVIARPTRSQGLYIQMAGRGLRVDPEVAYDEQDCLLLDVVGANSRHDLRSMADLSEKPLDPEKARSGRTLTELEDEFDAGEGVEEDAPEWYRGPVETREFDPMGRSRSNRVWLKTSNGTYFLPAGTAAYVFIFEYPSAGRWSVAWCAKEAGRRLYTCDEVPRNICVCDDKCKPKSVAMTEHADLDLEAAMGWAEDLAVDMGADTLNLANRKASWRNKPPSEKSLGMAARLGVKVVPGMKAGEVSDRITMVVASRRLDPMVHKVQAKVGA